MSTALLLLRAIICHFPADVAVLCPDHAAAHRHRLAVTFLQERRQPAQIRASGCLSSFVAGFADPGSGAERFSERLMSRRPDSNARFQIRVLRHVARRTMMKSGTNVPSSRGGCAASTAVSYPPPEETGARLTERLLSPVPSHPMRSQCLPSRHAVSSQTMGHHPAAQVVSEPLAHREISLFS